MKHAIDNVVLFKHIHITNTTYNILICAFLTYKSEVWACNEFLSRNKNLDSGFHLKICVSQCNINNNPY